MQYLMVDDGGRYMVDNDDDDEGWYQYTITTGSNKSFDIPAAIKWLLDCLAAAVDIINSSKRTKIQFVTISIPVAGGTRRGYARQGKATATQRMEG